MTGTKKSGKVGRAKGTGKKTAAGTRPVKPGKQASATAGQTHQREKDRWRELVEASAAWIWETDAAIRHTYTNAFVTRCLGYLPAEFLSLETLTLVHPDDHGLLKELVHNAAARREGWSDQVLRWRHKDGSWKYIESNGSALFDEQGTFTGLCGIDRDITDRKRAEEAARESEEWTRSIVGSIPMGMHMYRLDADGRLVFVGANAAADKILGVDNSIFIGKTIEEAFPPLKGTDVPQRYREAAASGKSWQTESIEYQDNAIKGAFEVHAFQTGPNSMVAAFEDITRRKKAEARINESEKKYRSLFESSTDGLFILDLDGNFIDVNPTAYRRLGYTKAEMLSLHISKLDAPEFAARVPERLRQIREKGVAIFDSGHRRKDGSVMQVEVNSRLLEYEGKQVYFSVIRDITERKQAEEAMRRSEKMLQTIFDAEPECVKLLDEDANLIMMNRAGLDMLDVDTLDQVKGQCVCPMVTSEYRQEFLDLTKRVFQGESGTLMFEIVGMKGRHLWMETHAVPLRDEKDAIVAFLGVTRDITERRRAEEALRESEERFRAITTTASDAILLMDDKGKIVYWNPAAERIFGYSADEAADRDLHVFLAPQRLHGDYQKGFARFAKTGQGPVVNRSVEMMAKRKDGTEFPIEISTSAMNINNKWHALGIVRDITERKLAETSLRQSEERFRDLTESLPLTVFETDLQGRFTYVNRAALEKFGYSQLEFEAGFSMFQAISPGDRDRAREVMARRLAGNAGGYTEYTGLRKDGTTFPITVVSIPILRDDHPVGLRGIAMDLSERKQLEEERLKSQKLESIGTLAGGIAHDFNNLLQGIFGYISMAKLTIDQREKSLAMLVQAEKALHQSVNLTSQLLTFSKGGKPVKTVIDLRPVIENAVKFALSGSRVSYGLSFGDDLCPVDADEGQIGQVVQNIVLNAEQAMPLGGRIEIAVRNVPPSQAAGLPLSAPDGLVEIVVRDQGMGIPPEHLPRIFDPYFTTKEKGSGLGLATSYSIVKNHDGTIDVSSVLGKGATFTVYLPATRAALVSAASSVSAGCSDGRKGRILVMDDEPVVRIVAGELLRELGHEAEFAEHGDSAIEKYRRAKADGRPFDVVILDLTIRGGMGGEETLRRLLEIDPAVKAVVSSGYSDDEVVAMYRQHGFRSFLKKPYDMLELGRTLDDVMA